MAQWQSGRLCGGRQRVRIPIGAPPGMTAPRDIPLAQEARIGHPYRLEPATAEGLNYSTEAYGDIRLLFHFI